MSVLANDDAGTSEAAMSTLPDNFWRKPAGARTPRPRGHRRMVEVIRHTRGRGGRSVHPRRGRQCGQRLPRRQRFPQDLRHRGLRAHGQRFRIDGPHQRRRLGNDFRQLAQGQPADARDAGAGVFGGRRQPGKKRQSEPGRRRSSYAKQVGARVIGIVGRDGGYTAKVADACVIVPTVNAQHVTPHTEAFQAVVWHLLVSHPALKACQTKWEAAA